MSSARSLASICCCLYLVVPWSLFILFFECVVFNIIIFLERLKSTQVHHLSRLCSKTLYNVYVFHMLNKQCKTYLMTMYILDSAVQ